MLLPTNPYKLRVLGKIIQSYIRAINFEFYAQFNPVMKKVGLTYAKPP